MRSPKSHQKGSYLFFDFRQRQAKRLPGSIGVAPAPLELILVGGEEDVEAGQRSIAAADVALQLDLHVVRQAGGVDLLLEGAEPIPQHDDFVEEGLDRPALLL